MNFKDNRKKRSQKIILPLFFKENIGNIVPLKRIFFLD